ncbi:MAG: carbon storage regulator [Desulfurellales bacterium]|nr:MAG: carbon storage regulator [Desulfurellales bacterium]
MLVISRRKSECLFVLDKQGKLFGTIKAMPRTGDHVRIGINIPKEFPIVRPELTDHGTLDIEEQINLPIGTPIRLLPRPAREATQPGVS